MSWSGTNSHIFAQWVNNPLLGVTGASGAGLPTGYAGLVADTVNLALYNNSITPDQTVSVANTAYNAGQWANTNEVTSGTDWVAGGRAVPATKSISVSTNVVTFKSTTNLSSVATATLSTYGALVYDNTITGGTAAKQGVCFLDFGGVQTVTGGTFSLNWNANGIFTITV
jgi:hypothetical protein